MTSGAGSEKAALRLQLLDARRRRSPADLASARASIAASVLALAATQGWRSVAAYRPLRTEPGSLELLSGLSTAGVRVITPVLLEDRDLDWTSGVDRLGVDAVRSVDAVLVPALAVSLTGMRLGRGGGSYDRVLARLDRSVPTYALLFADEVLAWVPSDPWDRAVDGAVTPSGVLALHRLDAE
jgi:5-formyltetrahydrofolate cyclo-ligase